MPTATSTSPPSPGPAGDGGADGKTNTWTSNRSGALTPAVIGLNVEKQDGAGNWVLFESSGGPMPVAGSFHIANLKSESQENLKSELTKKRRYCFRYWR